TTISSTRFCGHSYSEQKFAWFCIVDALPPFAHDPAYLVPVFNLTLMLAFFLLVKIIQHAPQYPNAGMGMDVELLDWLNKYTFPLEQSFASLDFAKAVYPRAVHGLLRNGTTTAVYY